MKRPYFNVLSAAATVTIAAAIILSGPAMAERAGVRGPDIDGPRSDPPARVDVDTNTSTTATGSGSQSSSITSGQTLGSTSTNIPRPGSLEATQIAQRYGTNARLVDPAEANGGHTLPPYDPRRPIVEFEANGTAQYSRFYAEGNSLPEGAWMTRAEDVSGMSPAQIQNYLDLRYTPTHVVDVTPRQGTTVRMGTVNSGNFGGDGGAVQFELQGQLPDDIFTNPRPL